MPQVLAQQHLQLVLLPAGFDKAGDNSNVLGNNSAFRDLLADLDVSRETADDLLKVLFDRFYRMADHHALLARLESGWPSTAHPAGIFYRPAAGQHEGDNVSSVGSCTTTPVRLFFFLKMLFITL